MFAMLEDDPDVSYQDEDDEETALIDKAFKNSSDSLEGLPSVSAAVYNLTKNRAVSTTSLKQDWIEQTFQKRECAKFIPTNRDPTKCGCGRLKERHPEHLIAERYEEKEEDQLQPHRRTSEKWSIRKHTVKSATDAHGTIEFQGGPHPYKAQYLRLSFDTDPADIMQLFENMWQITPPKLIITVHGGITNFDIQPKLARVFRKGLLKAARTTGAWIITSGINAGVVRHVAAALDGQSTTPRARSKIVCIGITPWGMLKKTEDFIGMDKAVDYHPHSFSPKGKFAVLNNRHSYYLLVDNGSVGRYGADIILRKRLEAYIAQKQKLGGKGSRSVPVVCVVLEGGTCTIRAVLDYVTRTK
uniref:LSDAT_euk domain-containing protein n=1 Tax=Steinernema glaseri TaxID=37863 RepID=A0A1I7ZKB5_9BILA